MQLNVTEQDLQLIGMGLGKLPYDSVVNLISKLNTQIQYEYNQRVKDELQVSPSKDSQEGQRIEEGGGSNPSVSQPESVPGSETEKPKAKAR